MTAESLPGAAVCEGSEMKRRDFMGAAVGTIVAAQGVQAQAQDSDGSPPPWDGDAMNPLADAGAGRGFQAPLRFNAEVEDCEVFGEIPGEIDGAFYRVGGEF